MNALPQTLFIETTTRCNLSCPMCARSAPGWSGGFGDMAPAVFDALAETLGQARAVILNGMGEPLLHPDLPEFIRRTRAAQRAGAAGWCGLQTNGLLLDAPLARGLARAGLDVLCLSHDGAAGLGHGGGGHLARAVDLLRAQDTPPRLGLETVLMAGNVAGLPDLVDEAAALGLDFVLASHLLPMDAAAEAESLFLPCSAASLRLFQGWREEAEARGLSVYQAARAAVKYHRTPAEQEALAFVRRMHESAREQGLWLNLKRLTAVDSGRLAGLEEIFAEARRRALAAGLALRLPALTAPERPEDRSCPFIENQAAFIDWQGNVSPCHFLWHGYQCRVLGDAKRVFPQRFGNVLEQPLGDIWRGAAFSAFRDTVRAGDYPACGDCALGMCYDASGAAGPFEQDCLGVDVPCGHCPWSLGQLVCLGS